MVDEPPSPATILHNGIPAVNVEQHDVRILALAALNRRQFQQFSIQGNNRLRGTSLNT
jgi:hypothetical protein